MKKKVSLFIIWSHETGQSVREQKEECVEAEKEYAELNEKLQGLKRENESQTNECALKKKWVDSVRFACLLSKQPILSETDLFVWKRARKKGTSKWKNEKESRRLGKRGGRIKGKC